MEKKYYCSQKIRKSSKLIMVVTFIGSLINTGILLIKYPKPEIGLRFILVMITLLFVIPFWVFYLINKLFNGSIRLLRRILKEKVFAR